LQARILSSERHHRAGTYDGGADQIVDYAISLFEKINTSSLVGADMASQIGEQLLLWEGIWNSQQPLIQTLDKTTAVLVSNAKKMHDIGELHTNAQSVVAERDRQLQQINVQLNEIGQLYTNAQSLVEERDRQLQQINVQLNEIGQLHTNAQSVVAERDRQLNEIGQLYTRAQSVVEERDRQLAQSQAQCQALDDENQSLRAHINRIRSTLLGRFSDWFGR
jgi:chromosome segregation ATPase